MRWGGSARDLMAGCLRGHAGATHSVEALDVADVLLDEELQLVGHGRHASAARARDQRHGGLVVVVMVWCGGDGGGGLTYSMVRHFPILKPSRDKPQASRVQ